MRRIKRSLFLMLVLSCSMMPAQGTCLTTPPVTPDIGKIQKTLAHNYFVKKTYSILDPGMLLPGNTGIDPKMLITDFPVVDPAMLIPASPANTPGAGAPASSLAPSDATVSADPETAPAMFNMSGK